MLAPLAGVTDAPFRYLCQEQGASLVYIEMLSATAIKYRSKSTLDRLKRHKRESLLGCQITGSTPEVVCQALQCLNEYPVDTIDLNMGCPVRKVVKNGGGSALLRDVPALHKMVRLAKSCIDKPLSVKIRLGWDMQHLNYLEVSQAIEDAGADWITVHGRSRADDYSVAVNLSAIAEIKEFVKIPVIGNGNLFSARDAKMMRKYTGVDGLMISRGALGNPWVFREIADPTWKLSLDEWYRVVLLHLGLQEAVYPYQERAVLRMRKHLLWYLGGWPWAKKTRKEIVGLKKIEYIRENLHNFVDKLRKGMINSIQVEREPLNKEGRFLLETGEIVENLS